MIITTPEILSALERYTGKFPEAAMREAIQQREAITPELLRVLQTTADAPKYAADDGYMLHVYALYLLAQFREKRAYPLVIKLICWPGETVDDLLSDTITEGLPSIPGSVFESSLEPLVQVALSEHVEPFVRSSVMDAMVLLSFEKIVARDDLIAAFRRLYRELTAESDSQAWNGLVTSTAEAGLSELLPEMREAFAKNLIDSFCTSLDFEERRLAEPEEERVKDFKRHHHLVENAIDEMSWWASFKEEKPAPKLSYPSAPTYTQAQPVTRADTQTQYTPPQPHRAEPKIGRNDPCPCGSGKKYKKCCLRS